MRLHSKEMSQTVQVDLVGLNSKESEHHNQEFTIIRYIFCHCSLIYKHLPRNTEDMGLNPVTGRYIVAQMTT